MSPEPSDSDPKSGLPPQTRSTGGREVVREDELEDATPYSIFKADGDPHQQERDTAKFWRHSLVRVALFGIENQTAIDRRMPARAFAYDGGAYKAQLLADKDLYPVITIVLYFGTEHIWKSPMLLSDCLVVHPELRPYFNDYKIHVVNVAFLNDEELDAYRSDFRIAAEYFVQARRTGEYTPRAQPVRHVHDTLQMMQVLTGDRRFERALAEGMEGREMTMIDMLSKIENRGIERGIQEGMLSTLFGLVRDDILTAQSAADRAKLSLSAFKAKMAEHDAQSRSI